MNSALTGSSSSTSTDAIIRTGAARAMTKNTQNDTMGKIIAAVGAAPKKKSVRWGENIEYPAPTSADDDGTAAGAAAAATGSSSSSSSSSALSAMNERYPTVEMNGPNYHQYQIPPHLPPHHHQQEAQSHETISKNPMCDKEHGDMSICRLPGHTHIWKNCPDNPRSKRYKGGEKKKKNKKGWVPPPGTAGGAPQLAPTSLMPGYSPPGDAISLQQPAAAAASSILNTAHGGEQQIQKQKQKQQKLGPLTPCNLPFPGHSDHVWKDCPNNPRSKFFCGVSNRDLLFQGINSNADRTAIVGENEAPPQELQQQHHHHQQQPPPPLSGHHDSNNRGGVHHAGLPTAELGTNATIPVCHSQQHQENPHQHHHPRQKEQKQQHRQPQPLKQWGNNSICKIPGHSGHLWKACPNNPNSHTFDGNFASFLMLAPVGSVVASNTTLPAPPPPPLAAPPISSGVVVRKQPPTILPSSNGEKSTMPFSISSSTRSTATSGGVVSGSTDAHHNIISRSVPRKTSFLAPPASAESLRPIPQRTSSFPPLTTMNNSVSTDPARSITHRASFLPPTSGSGISTNMDRLFNKTDSARPIPRKTSKAGVQQHQHQHIQSLQNLQSQQGQHIEKMVTNGIRGRRRIQRAPYGTDAIPLQKHTSSRLLKVQKGIKNSSGGESIDSTEPHLAGEEGSPEGVSNLLVDGRRRGGDDDDDDDDDDKEEGKSLTFTASLQGKSKRRMDESLSSEANSVPPPLKKSKSSNVQKDGDGTKSINKKRRKLEKVGGKGKGKGKEDALKLPSLQVPRQKSSIGRSLSTSSMTSEETFDAEGLGHTEDDNEVKIPKSASTIKAAFAALSYDDEVVADDTNSYGENFGEDVSMLDDEEHASFSDRPSNRQSKVRCATASFPSSAPNMSKKTSAESEDNDNATYLAALAALDYDVGTWKKLSFNDDLSISDNNDLPMSTICEQHSTSKGKKYCIDSIDTSIDDGVSLAFDDDDDDDDDDDKMIDKIEKDLFDHIADVINLKEQWNIMMFEGRENEGKEVTEVSRSHGPLGIRYNSGDRDSAKRRTEKKDKSNSPAKKSRKSNVPTHQSAVSPTKPAAWTNEEKRLYELGVQNCPNNWGKIASEYVKSRTAHQVREYARSCIGLTSSCQRIAAEEVIVPPTSPHRLDFHLEQQQKELPEGSNTQMAVSTDNALSLSEEIELIDKCIPIEKMQTATNDCPSSGIVSIGGKISSPLPASPNHNENTSTGTESSYGAANVSEDVDDDDNIQAFITCNKCCLVFDDMDKATKHEKNCTFIANDGTDSRPLRGRIFRDKKTLVQYMYHRYLERLVDREDEIYYCP